MINLENSLNTYTNIQQQLQTLHHSTTSVLSLD